LSAAASLPKRRLQLFPGPARESIHIAEPSFITSSSGSWFLASFPSSSPRRVYFYLRFFVTTVMSRYALISLPQSAFDSGDRDEAISSLSATITSDNGTVLPFSIPDFKIGTLDLLVQQADDLAKLDAACQSVVAKVADSLRTVLNNDEDRMASYKMVNDS
jgi:hypothetical protein